MSKVKAPKIDTLRFIAKMEVIQPGDLVARFKLSPTYVYVKLARLEKAGLIEKMGSVQEGAYCLTNKGYGRLRYHDEQEEE